MEKGAVTFLDILGWKGIWQRDKNALEKLTEIVLNCEKWIEDIQRKEKELDPEFPLLQSDEAKVTSISDTIVITSKGEKSESSLLLHAKLSSKIVVECLKRKLFIRGATGWGEFSQKDNIFVGPAIDETASWHELADWIGVMQTPSAKYESICPNGTGFSMTKYSVPLKKGKFETRCIDWPSELLIEQGDKYTAELFLRDIFVEQSPIFPSIAPKYENTLAFFEYCLKDK